MSLGTIALVSNGTLLRYSKTYFLKYIIWMIELMIPLLLRVRYYV